MKTITITAIAAATLSLAACGSKTSTGTAANETAVNTAEEATTAPTASAAQTFANAAAASDAFEIAASELAKPAGASTKVKAYAARMIEAHTGSTAKLKGIVAGLTPPITPDATLTSAQQGVVDSLKGKIGKAFDTAYAAAQVEAHQTTLDTLKAYGANGDVPALKTFATGLVPTVTAHLNSAKAL